MCGRYTLNADAETLQREFNLAELPTIEARYNIAPSQPVPVITNAQPDALTLVKWGLVPSWADDPNSTYKMINARAETVAEKPSYRTPFKRRRCLVPSTGFYEWTEADGGKQPHFITVADADVFSFAGLWEVWQGGDGDELWTCTIITTQAAASIEHLHHRMPVILDSDAREAWLDDSSDQNELLHLLQPYDADRLAHYPVSKEVNNVRNDHPALIEEDEPPQQQSLF